MTVSYATVPQLRRHLYDGASEGTDADGVAWDDVLTDILLAASRHVDRLTGRTFYKQTTVTKTYRVRADGRVSLDDLTSASPTVLYDLDGDDTPEQSIPATELLFEPFQDSAGVAAVCYQWAHVRRLSSYRMIPGYLVSFAGNWGYYDTLSNGTTAAPPAIQRATILLSARVFARRGARLGATVIPETDVRETLSNHDPDVARLIEPFIHPRKSIPV